MGKLKPGKKFSRKNVIRAAEANFDEMTKYRRITEQAILYNGGLHKSLQHELCTCSHGASKHFEHPTTIVVDHPCTVVDCECKAFKSNYDQSLENWKTMVWAELDQKHNIKPGSELAGGPADDSELIKSFEIGVKAEDHAKAVVEWLNAKTAPSEPAEVKP